MRNIFEVCDEMINVVNEQFPDYCELFVRDINKLKNSASYRAPELQYIDWNQLTKIVNDYTVSDELSPCDIKLLSILCDMTEDEIIKIHSSRLGN